MFLRKGRRNCQPIFFFFLFCLMKSCPMKLFLFEYCLRIKGLSQNKKRGNERAAVRMIEMIFIKKLQVAASLSTKKVELLITFLGLAEVREFFLQTFYKAQNKVKRKIVLRRIATRIFAKPMLPALFLLSVVTDCIC